MVSTARLIGVLTRTHRDTTARTHSGTHAPYLSRRDSVLCSAGSQCECQCESLCFSCRRPSLLGPAICSRRCGTRRSLWLQVFFSAGKNCQLEKKRKTKKLFRTKLRLLFLGWLSHLLSLSFPRLYRIYYVILYYIGHGLSQAIVSISLLTKILVHACLYEQFVVHICTYLHMCDHISIGTIQGFMQEEKKKVTKVSSLCDTLPFDLFFVSEGGSCN